MSEERIEGKSVLRNSQSFKKQLFLFITAVYLGVTLCSLLHGCHLSAERYFVLLEARRQEDDDGSSIYLRNFDNRISILHVVTPQKIPLLISTIVRTSNVV
jgi:hypothetical protein